MAGNFSKAAGRLDGGPAEAVNTLMNVVIFIIAVVFILSYAGALGIWLLLDFPIAILYAVFHKGKKTVAVECDERSDCVLQNDLEIQDLCELKRCLKQTMVLSEEGLSAAILLEAGFTVEDVLKREETARIQKPAFTVIRDIKSESLFVFIRGTRSFNDMLTDAMAMAVPVSFNLRTNEVVSGHAHSGMLAAARWIEEQCTPLLIQALGQNPSFKIKIVGHSLGGGTAALLTYMLREKPEFSSCTCVTFGPVQQKLIDTKMPTPCACMTLELAELGKPFITSLINGSDMVPTLSVSSFQDFIAGGRIKREKFLNATCSALRSCLPFFNSPNAIADHAVTHVTQEHELEAHDQEKINYKVVYTKESAGAVRTLDNLDKHLYPPGTIMHIVPASSSEESNSNHNDDPDAKHVSLYETPTQFYGKLRLSRRVIDDHVTSEYLKGLQQLIIQRLETCGSSDMVDDELESNGWNDIGYQWHRGALKLIFGLLVILMIYIYGFQVHASPPLGMSPFRHANVTGFLL